MAKQKGPTRRQRREVDASWGTHQPEAVIPAVSVDDAWEIAEADGLAGGVILSEAESAEIRDGLSDYHFMDTATLEEMVGTSGKDSRDYRMAQAVLLQRPAEFQPGHGADRYKGASMPVNGK